MNEGVKNVLWVRLLPDQIKGGPQSEFQRDLRARQAAAVAPSAPVLPSFRDTTPIGMAEGGSPHTLKFQNLAEKLKKQGKGKSAFPIAMHALGYEGSIKAGHRRKPGYDAGGYTGDSGDHIEADRVASEKTFVDHDGEFYVNAPMTGILGGPDAVEAIMLEAAKKKIAAAEQGAPQIRDVKPIVSSADAGKSYAPISEIRSSFELGGAVKKIGDPAAGDVTKIDPSGSSYSGDRNVSGISSQPNVSTQNVTNPGFSMYTPPVLDASGQDATLSTGEKSPTSAPVLAANAQDATLSTGEQASKLGAAGVGQSKISASTTGLSATTGSPTAGGQNLINSATKYYQGIMTGDDPYYKSLLESNLQKHGASAGASKAALQQRLAQEGIVGPAAEAALASADRTTREQAAGIQTGLAQQELGQQSQAAGQLASIGTQEKTFDYQKNLTAMSTALQAGDIAGFAKAASTALGVNIDTTQLKTKQDLENLNSAYTTLNQLNTQFGNNWNTDTAGAKNALQSLYTSSGGKGDMPADWASNQISSIQRASDPLVQAASSLTEEDAKTLFGDVSKYVGANGEVGMAGVTADWAKLMVTGGLTMNKADGTFSVDPSKDPNGLLSKMFGGGASGTVVQIPTSTALNGTFSDGGVAYTVSKADGAGKPTEVTAGGVAYSVTAGKDGTSVLKKISDSTGITPIANGNTTDVYYGGQQLQFNDPVTGTLSNVTQTAPGVYMVGNSHVAIDGTTGKVNLTGVNSDASGNATYSDGKGTTSTVTAPDGSAVKMDSGSTQYGVSANGQRVVVSGTSGAASAYGYSNWTAQYGGASADIQHGKDSVSALNDAVRNGDPTTSAQAATKLKEIVDGIGGSKLADMTCGTGQSAAYQLPTPDNSGYAINFNNLTLAKLKEWEAALPTRGAITSTDGKVIKTSVYTQAVVDSLFRHVESAIATLSQKTYTTAQRRLTDSGVTDPSAWLSWYSGQINYTVPTA